jgi:hypothetical protein
MASSTGTAISLFFLVITNCLKEKKTRERSSALAFYAFLLKKKTMRERERSSEGELDRISNLSVV